MSNQSKQEENKFEGLEEIPVYRLTGSDVISIIEGKGYNLTYNQMKDVIDYFKHKFEIENWSEDVEVTLDSYFRNNPSNDINDKEIKF